MNPPENKRTVVVFGATGQQGGACVDALLAYGGAFAVRAVTRDPESAKARALRDKGAEVVKAGLGSSKEELTAAMAGAWGLFLLTMPQGYFDSSREKVEGTAVVDAAFEAGVKYVVYSSGGALDSPLGQTSVVGAGKYAVEEHIKAKGFPDGWAFLRPDFFMENLWMFSPLTRGRLPLTQPAHLCVPWISARDIGAFAAMAFARPDEFRGKGTELGLEMLSMVQVAEILTELTGTPWTCTAFPPRWAIKLVKPLDELISSIELGYLKPDAERLRRLKPDVEDFRSWCKRNGLCRAEDLPPGVREYPYRPLSWSERLFGWTGLV